MALGPFPKNRTPEFSVGEDDDDKDTVVDGDCRWYWWRWLAMQSGAKDCTCWWDTVERRTRKLYHIELEAPILHCFLSVLFNIVYSCVSVLALASRMRSKVLCSATTDDELKICLFVFCFIIRIRFFGFRGFQKSVDLLGADRRWFEWGSFLSRTLGSFKWTFQFISLASQVFSASAAIDSFYSQDTFQIGWTDTYYTCKTLGYILWAEIN